MFHQHLGAELHEVKLLVSVSKHNAVYLIEMLWTR